MVPDEQLLVQFCSGFHGPVLHFASRRFDGPCPFALVVAATSFARNFAMRSISAVGTGLSSGKRMVRLQTARARFVAQVCDTQAPEELAAEESVVRLLREAFSDGDLAVPASPSTMRLIRRTKEFLADQLGARVRLVDAARAAGASPAYLTHVFSRFEGMSLHQYLTGLRLSHALADLPHTDNLTALALDVGFSSHSHFTAAFRRAYGVTPSAFRELSRKQISAIRPRLDGADRQRRAS